MFVARMSCVDLRLMHLCSSVLWLVQVLCYKARSLYSNIFRCQLGNFILHISMAGARFIKTCRVVHPFRLLALCSPLVSCSFLASCSLHSTTACHPSPSFRLYHLWKRAYDTNYSRNPPARSNGLSIGTTELCVGLHSLGGPWCNV